VHFLTLSDLPLAAHEKLMDRAVALKARRKRGERDTTLAGRTLVLIFEKASTRTRLSFEAAIGQLGGQAITLSVGDSQLARGESWADTARVVSGYADAVMIRTFADARLQEFAKHSKVPVINGLTDLHHPCQVLADLFTLVEHRRKLGEIKVAFIGDGNNLVHSWMEAATLFPFTFAVACPKGYEPNTGLVAECQARGAKIEVTPSVTDAVRGADVLYTDVWTSMGQEEETAVRRASFADYQINDDVLRHAAKDALVMHCLPAHRGEEITDAVIEGRQSIIFDQAENRLHLQKALMAWLARESSK
jgi:ornithine carbamoyltransferase